jgi:hypothetical protein
MSQLLITTERFEFKSASAMASAKIIKSLGGNFYELG